jgi:hypothetical protein
VGRAVHPPVEGGLSCTGRVRRDHEVLAYPGICVTLPSNTISHGGSIRSGMAVEPVAGHIGGMDTGSGKELALHVKRRQSARLSLIIDKPHDCVLVRRVDIRGASGGDLCWGIARNRGICRRYHTRLRRRDEGIQRVGLGWCECSRRRG